MSVKQAIQQVKQVWSEMDYAQRRLFEIRTGIPVTAPPKQARNKSTVDELQALYTLER